MKLALAIVEKGLWDKRSAFSCQRGWFSSFWAHALWERVQAAAFHAPSARMDWDAVDAYNRKRAAATIRAARKHQSLTQGQCAELIERDERFYQDLEYSEKAPSLEIYLRCVWLLEQKVIQKRQNEMPLPEVKKRLRECRGSV